MILAYQELAITERLTARISCVADEPRPPRPKALRRVEPGRLGAPISHVSCMRSLAALRHATQRNILSEHEFGAERVSPHFDGDESFNGDRCQPLTFTLGEAAKSAGARR